MSDFGYIVQALTGDKNQVFHVGTLVVDTERSLIMEDGSFSPRSVGKVVALWMTGISVSGDLVQQTKEHFVVYVKFPEKIVPDAYIDEAMSDIRPVREKINKSYII